MSTSVKFGGLDLALRVDNTVLEVLTLEDGILDQTGQKVWPHMKFSEINDDLVKINKLERFKCVSTLKKSVMKFMLKILNVQKMK